MFFPDPARGLAEFRRVLRPGCGAAACVISSPERAPMWGVLGEILGRHLPGQAEPLQWSFSLADAERLAAMFRAAGFRDVRVQRESREGIVGSFDEHWAPIESGTGMMPQAYLALAEPARRAVREEVRARLSRFESNGRLVLEVEMLIGSGRV
jgi:hypothetical protein